MAPDAIAPDGSEVYFKIGDGERASLVEVRLAAGRVSRPVRHRVVEEIWYVTAGEGRVWLEPPGGPGQTIGVRPGDALRVPAGGACPFAAAGRAALGVPCITDPAGP